MYKQFLLVTQVVFSVALFQAIIAFAETNSESKENFAWEKQYAKVLSNGDLEWSPAPFNFESGDSVRYIDFESGNDNNDGTTKDQPWKHHPWDPTAEGKAKECKGVHTYVFKCGSIYRGRLIILEAGEKGNPIRLTSDPTWGTGEACFYGSEIVKDWISGGHEKMPEKEKVWRAKLTFAPRLVCVVDKNGKITRLNLARTPNWKASNINDFLAECWSWENPEWWVANKYKGYIGKNKVIFGVDKKNLIHNEDYYKGALVWSEWGIVMGAPYASIVEGFNPEKKEIAFTGPWYGDSANIHTNHRYWLEDKPEYLDEPGEFWFDKEGDGGTLYVRLPEDINPELVTIEAGNRVNLIEDKASALCPERIDILNQQQKENLESFGAQNIEITGLTFRFTNIFWRLDFQPWNHKEVDSATIRFFGNCNNVKISNCKFEYTPKAIRITSLYRERKIENIIISDNKIISADHGGIDVSAGETSYSANPPAYSLFNINILRNYLSDIGFRPARPNGHMALKVNFPETALIAGNIIERCGGAGLFIFGGKPTGANYSAPFNRIIIQNNKVVDSLLIANDWGGIETWQGGPFYVYNNISGNALGPFNWGNKTFGHAYYLDGSFKNYLFNNIAFGKNNDPKNPRFANCAAFQEIHSYENTFFNNTVYKFLEATRRQAPQAGRNKYISIIFDDVSKYVFRHSDKEGQDPNARDAGAQAEHFDYPTNVYSRNIFYQISGKIGVFEAEGGDYSDLSSFSNALAKKGTMVADAGILATSPVLRDPANGDFRLTENSAAVGMGSKVFVPWGLYDTVGEWGFYLNPTNPAKIEDEHWNMKANMTNREKYHNSPNYPLTGVNISETDYVYGELEDWVKGSLKLNGINQYLFLKNQDGAAEFNPDITTSNFIIETYLKIESNAEGVIVEKIADTTGYSLTVANNGKISFEIKSGEKTTQLLSSRTLNDVKWHHILAEADRKNNKITLYIDGNKDASAELNLQQDASLKNNSDLFVGGTPKGRNLSATFDFLRISRGSLADAKTSIEELYKWQSDGPFLRDFCGVKPSTKRDAGALQTKQ